jgi:hypothetical protein
MARKPLDWTKTGTIVAMAEWLRKSGDELAVVVIRPSDAAFAADPILAAADAGALIEHYLPQLVEDLAKAHQEKRAAGRLELGEMHE